MFTIFSPKCSNPAGTRNEHSVHIIRNILEQNETSNAYYWDEAHKYQHKSDASRNRWHKGTYIPKPHPQTYVEFGLKHKGQTDDDEQYQFLVHSKMEGNGCRPTLRIQFLPGQGNLGARMLYDFSEPLPDPKASSDLQSEAQKHSEIIQGY